MAVPRVCSVTGCGNSGELKRGYCNMHYKRWRRHGDPLIGGRTRLACSVPKCENPHVARGWCRLHYRRWRSGQSLLEKPQRGPAQRFFKNVVLSYEGDDCLIWPYFRSHNGRGLLYVRGRMKSVSRLVCHEVNGPPPSPSHQAAHSCGKGHEGCVAKRHVSWKTPTENEADKVRHGTLRFGEAHQGAQLTEESARQILLMKGSASAQKIADLFGTSRSNVRLIHTGKAWRRALAGDDS